MYTVNRVYLYLICLLIWFCNDLFVPLFLKPMVVPVLPVKMQIFLEAGLYSP